MTLKERLLKIKLAAIGMPSNFNTESQLDRRHKIQQTKKTTQGLELPRSGETAQRRVKQEVEYINKGEKIKPTTADRKFSTKLKKRLAQLKQAQDELDYETIERDIKPLKGTKENPYKRHSPKVLAFQKKEREQRKQRIDKARREYNERMKNAKEHGHSIVFKGNPLGVYRAASLEGQQGKYAKYWLLNAKQTNGNGWGIASHTAKENMRKFIGRPLVVTSSKWHGASVYGERFEHPYLPTDDLNQIFAHQEQFRVGSIVDIEDHNGDYFATIEMLPRFANMNLPPFCSPAIYQLDAQEHEGQISKWEALHLAALDENPAYGARIALLKGTCVGTANSCKVQFKSAKLEKKKIEDEDEDYDEMRDKREYKVGDTGLKRTGQIICPNKLKERLGKLKKNQKLAFEFISRGGGSDNELQQESFKRFQIGDNLKADNILPRVTRERQRNYIEPSDGSISELAEQDVIENKKLNDIRSILRGRYITEKRSGLTPTKIRPHKPTEEDRIRIISAKLKERLANIYDEQIENKKPEEPRKRNYGSDRYFTTPEHMEDMPAINMKKKLKKRLASLGEQNMTYQKSKHMKILKKKHPEVRKAQNNIEDILRKQGRSVDASHAPSSWLSSSGDFIGGGKTKDNPHVNQILDISPDSLRVTPNGIDSDRIVSEFSSKHSLPRVQRFRINRAGENKVSMGIHSPINSNQLKSIQELEKGGKVIGFAVGPDHKTATTGEGFSNLVKSLREHKFL